MKLIILVSLLVFASQESFAVDGYKDLKFGISLAALKAKKPCTLTLMPAEENDKSVTTYACTDYKWGSGHADATFFYFINSKFLRMAIEIPVNTVGAVITGLKEKYGAPTTSPSSRALASVDESPNARADIGFDKDTVWLSLSSGADMTQTAMLIYSSSEFGTEQNSVQKQTIKNDL